MESKESDHFIAVSYQVGNETSSVPSIRHLFVKQHFGKDDIRPSSRTLFVLNVPQYFNNKSIEYLYGHCGEIERIFIHKKPKGVVDVNEENINSVFSNKEPCLGYKVVYIVFKQASSLLAALKCRELPVLPKNKFKTQVALNKWVREYNSSFINVSTVEKEIETYMSNYDQKLEEEKQKSKEMENADEDGWITVTKYSKKPKISRKEGVSRRIIEKQKKEAEKKTILNFYRCQLRDKKMEEILELQKKFEKDKKRIALMKENRKFRPF